MSNPEFRQDVWLDATQAAERAGKSARTLRHWASKKAIRHCRTAAGRVLFCREDFTKRALRSRKVDQILRSLRGRK